MFMDISSEMVHSLLPIYMSVTLGASMLTIGLVEGVAEGTASVMKLFSGVLSDVRSRRKPLVFLGYGLSALTKPAFPLASSIGWVAAARFTDRIGKGIREAPRDALMADVTPAEIRGAAYGLRQALDSVGAFVGPLAAIMLMIAFSNQVKVVLWLAVLPAVIAVAMLTGVSEPKRAAAGTATPIRLGDVSLLGPNYWWIVALAAVFTLARFSDAFLILRAQSVGVH
jgi:sugar phosphate permease